MDSSHTAMEALRRQLVGVQRDYHHLLAENAMLKEQNYQLSQSLNIVVSKLTQLGYRVEPPFDIGAQIKKVREIREETLKAAAAMSAGTGGVNGASVVGNAAGRKQTGLLMTEKGSDSHQAGGAKNEASMLKDASNGMDGDARGAGQGGTAGGSGTVDGLETSQANATANNAAGGGSKVGVMISGSQRGGGGGVGGGGSAPLRRFRCVAELKEHKSHVQSAAFAPYFGEDSSSSSAASNGNSSGSGGAFAYLATGAFDSRINIWRIPSSVADWSGSSNAGKDGSRPGADGKGDNGKDVLEKGSDSMKGDGKSDSNLAGSSANNAAASSSFPPPAKYSSVASIVNGHSKNVAALSWCYDYGGLLISSSFDGTSKVWNVEGCTGLRPQAPPAPAHTVNAIDRAYMVANCALSGLSYACADTRSMCYVVDFRSSGSSLLIPTAAAAGSSALPSAGGGGASPVVSWRHNHRITSLCGDRTNPNLLVTAHSNGTIKVWDLRKSSQPIAATTTTAPSPADAVADSADVDSHVDPSIVSDRLHIRASIDGAAQPSSSPFQVVTEWSNDDSRAAVWHIALSPSLVSSGLGGGGGAASRPSSNPVGSSAGGGFYDNSLLSIAEDGMARIYSVWGQQNSGGGGSGGNGDTFKHALRSVVPGLHARGMPVKASLWLGATFTQKNPFYTASALDAVSGASNTLENRSMRSTKRSQNHNAFDHDDDDDDDDEEDDDDAPTSPALISGGSASNGGVLGGGAGGHGSQKRRNPMDAKVHESDLLIVGSATGNASVFDVTDPDNPVFLETLEGHKSLVTGVSVLPPSARWRKPLVATYSNDHTVRLYTSVGNL